MIVLEMKCPQLSKPEVTAARNQNSIGDTMEKKPLGETRLSRGASSPLASRTSSLFQLQQSQIVRAPLIPGVFSRWMSRWRGPHWASVSGAHLCVLDSADVQKKIISGLFFISHFLGCYLGDPIMQLKHGKKPYFHYMSPLRFKGL